MSALSWPKAPAWGSTWGSLYRIGGIAGILVVVLDAADLVLNVNPPPVSGGEATLRFIADHKASYIALQLLWLVPALFGLIVFVALLIALLPTSPSLTVLGFAVGAASWTALLAVPVTSQGTLSLVYLSDQYAAAADASARSAFAAAAEAFVAENNTIALAGVLTPLGILLIALPMIRGILPHWAGWLGIATGALGLAAEALRFLAPGLYSVYGPLMLVWFAVVGVSLLQLPRRSEYPARSLRRRSIRASREQRTA